MLAAVAGVASISGCADTERITAAGAHIVGATLTKSSEEASHYGYRLYHYTSVADKRNQIVLIVLIPQQAEG